MQWQEQERADFLSKRYQDKRIQLRLNIHRNTLIAFLASILFHALLLWRVIVPMPEMSSPFPKSDKIVVTLAPPPKAPVPTIDNPPPPSQETMPEPPQVQEVRKPPSIAQPKTPASPPVKSREPVLTAPTSQEHLKTEPEPSPPVPPTPQNSPPVDMMALVNRNRARRQQIESEAARLNAEAAAAERGPTEEQLRNQRIMENLRTGTNGIFEVRRIDSLGGSFSFRGWTNDYNSSTLQYFDVPAQPGVDIRLSMVRRMIGLIREHYQEDFIWESHRLGRSVTLSARLEDNAGLEEFLMKEFFGPQSRN